MERVIDGEQLDASFTALPVIEVRERQLDAQLSDWLGKIITKTAPLLPRKLDASGMRARGVPSPSVVKTREGTVTLSNP